MTTVFVLMSQTTKGLFLLAILVEILWDVFGPCPACKVDPEDPCTHRTLNPLLAFIACVVFGVAVGPGAFLVLADAACVYEGRYELGLLRVPFLVSLSLASKY